MRSYGFVKKLIAHNTKCGIVWGIFETYTIYCVFAIDKI